LYENWSQNWTRTGPRTDKDVHVDVHEYMHVVGFSLRGLLIELRLNHGDARSLAVH